MRILSYIVGVLLVVYVLLVAGLAYAMHQPPETFGQVMGRIPRIAMPALFPILPFKPIWTWARAGALRVGDPAPDFTLPTTDKSRRVQLSSFRGVRPVVLVFGSYTWPPFRREVPELNRLYREHRTDAEFFVVYIQEAHPTDAWQLASNEEDKVLYADPKTLDERTSLAGVCVRNLGIEFPAVVDVADNRTERAYTGWPDRLYVIDRDGRVAYKSAPGPYGFKPAEMGETLARVVGRRPTTTGDEATD